MIETERLLLREYTIEDYDSLYEIMSDAETMQHYPAPFDEARTRRWIEWNLENYAQYGFGLWAVVLKETGEFIGDCGLTLQNIDGEMLPEIGYHIHKKYWRRGFAKEASRAVAATLRGCYSAKLRARAERMEKCNNFFLGELCPVCHTFHATQGSRCRDRLCPDCGWTLAIERSSGVRRP